MKIRSLLNHWEATASGALHPEYYSVRLAVEDAAKLAALCEMFPRRSPEQLIGDLLSAALGELETTMPYVESSQVISEDELGDPIYADQGPTPRFLALTQKYLSQLKPQ